MTADERALVRAVIAAPDDDLPRLVYADWLEEHGRSDRAEFIRVDCELVRLRLNDPESRRQYNRLWSRQRKLFEVYASEWEGEVRSALRNRRGLQLQFVRGMIGEVSCSVKFFIDHGEKLFQIAPIERVVLSGVTPAAARGLGRASHLSRVLDLRFPANETSPDTALAVLDECPLGGLRTLSFSRLAVNLSESALGEYTEVAARIAGCTQLNGLKRLNLSAAQIGDIGGRALANASALQSLEYLNLLHNSLSDRADSLLRARWVGVVVLNYSDRQRFPVGLL